MRRARRATLGALAVAVVLAGVGCSDDDDTSSDADPTTTESAGSTEEGTEDETQGTGAEETGTGEADAELVAFCESFAALNAAFQGDGGPPPEEGEAMIAEVEETAPEELAEPVAALVATARERLAGDEEAFDDAFFETLATVDEYRYDTCPTEARFEVSGIEYAFEGAPDTVPAGTVGFKLTNDGAEEHEMVVIARNEGETRPFEELIDLSDAEAEEAVRFVGAAFAPPGADAVMLADLEAGEYAMVCFIPVGGAGDGPPHAHEGMLHEFTVT